jgi:hypothetical protein
MKHVPVRNLASAAAPPVLTVRAASATGVPTASVKAPGSLPYMLNASTGNTFVADVLVIVSEMRVLLEYTASGTELMVMPASRQVSGYEANPIGDELQKLQLVLREVLGLN